MINSKKYSIHELITNLINLLGRLWTFIIFLYLAGVILIIIDLQVSHQNDTEAWSKLLKEKLHTFSMDVESEITASDKMSSVKIKIDLFGVIQESSNLPLIGLDLKNSSLFKKIVGLNVRDEYILLESGLLENRLKAFFIKKNMGGYTIVSYPPEEFFPITRFNTVFLFFDNNGQIIYSTQQNLIGTNIKPKILVFRGWSVYHCSNINLKNSDTQKLYIFRDIASQFYILLFIGFSFAASIFILSRPISKIKESLKVLKDESQDINLIVKELSSISEDSEEVINNPLTTYKQILGSFQTELLSKELVFTENIKTTESYKQLIEMLLDLLNRIDLVLEKQRVAENKYRKIFENSNDGIFQFSNKGELFTVNNAMASLYGSINPRELLYYLETLEDKILEEKDLFYLLNRENGSLILEKNIKRIDGSFVDVLINARAINDVDRNNMYIQGNMRDMTAEKDVLRFKLEKERIETTAKAKSDFFANISHELRTPLNSVIGFSELLSATIQDSKHKSYINAILTSGKSLLTLINDILDLSKLESGNMSTTIAPFNIKSLLTDIEQVFSFKIKEKNLKYLLELDKNIPEYLLSDETKLRQILINLIGNSIKFTEEGFVKISALLVEKKDVKSETFFDILIKVEDSGRGMDNKALNNIFNEFQQEGFQEGIIGTGLGLSICKRLIGLLGGVIDVESNIDIGTCFNIHLKNIKEGEWDGSLELYDKKNESFRNYEFDGQKILIIDDEELNRDIVVEALTMVGLKMYEAENGKTGIDIAKEIIPDLILLDLRMPVLNGWEALKQIKHDNDLKQIPIIAYTASIEEKSAKSIQEDGFDDIIMKPAKVSSILEKIGNYIPYTIIDEIPEIQDIISEVIIPKEYYSEINELLPKFDKGGSVIKIKDMKAAVSILKTLDSTVLFANKLNDLIESYDINGIESLLKETKLLKDEL